MKAVTRVLGKSVWPLADRLLRLALSVGVGVLVARHLGTENYGLLSFAAAWASFFGGLAWLGLGEAVTRDLVRRPHDRDRILSNVVSLRLLGSLAALLLAVALLPLVYPDETPSAWLLVAVIAAASLFSEPGGAATIWMVATSRTELIGTTRTLPHVVAQVLRVGLVAIGASAFWFALAVPLEAALLLLLSWWVYARETGTGLRPRWEWPLARRLLTEATPTLFAALATALSLRLDQMMLAKLSGFSDVGIYAAALRFSEVWWMIPTALMQVAAPILLFGNEDASSRRRYLLGMYGLLLGAALVLATLMAAVGRPLVAWVLGSAFDGADAVLVVHIWTAVFVFADAVTAPELIRQDAQRLLLAKALCVLAVNAALNVWWIPDHGAIGAAWATLAAMACATALFGLIFKPTRDLLLLQLISLPWLLRWAGRRAGFGGRH